MGCYRFTYETHIFHRIERTWIEFLYYPDNGIDVFTFYNCEDGLNGSFGAFCIDNSDAIPCRSQICDEFIGWFASYNANNHFTDRNHILDDYSDIIAGGITCCIGDKTQRAVQSLEDLTQDHKPDQHLEERANSGVMRQASVDENNAQCTQAYINDTSEKDKQGQDYPGICGGVKKGQHIHNFQSHRLYRLQYLTI